MKSDIHPDYLIATVRCSCGNEFTTRATQDSIRVELCNECHPFYTGKQKLVDTGGRVERYKQRFAKTQAKRAEAEQAEADKKA
ncbi:MAG TPA: 50S ribosomal protein L31 [Egibacteraceae bacterium]|nr:50S ribosomal protein L31 [Egibacteraceae bacterium]